ncbi:MAG: UDP-2,3-diacylglucosamine diphosphatase [Gammaproteobacteria bacterium]|nr:UDP-2,3-diacylglucosamine diphosphatase [Gammaproteobacteria bacterium]
MTAIFVSDLHIDDPHPQILEGFRAMLDREADAAQELYILGDLVEVWVGDDDDSALADAVRETLRAAAARCPVYLMHGNRDFMIGERFAVETGVTLIEDPHFVVIEGRRLVLAHGDAFCTADTEYQQMRTLFRSRKWQAEMLDRPLSERRTLARGLREQSVQVNSNKAQNIMDVTQTEVVQVIEDHEAHALIHGHTHRPGIQRLTVGDQPAKRIVLGDWNRCGWLLRLGATERLECFAL